MAKNRQIWQQHKGKEAPEGVRGVAGGKGAQKIGMGKRITKTKIHMNRPE